MPRIRVVGNGEPTLHPEFSAMISELGKACGYVQVVTNGQLLNQRVIDAMLRAPVRLIEVSVNSNSAEGYAASRVGGSLSRLLSNLTLLRNRRDALRAPALVNIRVMIRPSEETVQKSIAEFWKPYADTVMTQYLHDYTHGNDPDVFRHVQMEGIVPRCSLPEKAMIVHYTGRVPVCELSQQQTGIPEGLIAGDISEQTLEEIWNSDTFVQYRRGHRERRPELLPICRGCVSG